MLRKYRKLLYYAEVVTDAVVLFVAYVISMYIRYYVMDSEPGLSVLSAPYLLMALVYSVVMACIFAFALGDNRGRGLYAKSNDSGMYKLLAINVVGCLFLVSAFYIIGVMYFSRWALVLFWGISSVLLMVKKGVWQNFLTKKNRKAQLGMSTVVVGDGELARTYISSAYSFPVLGRNVAGYVRVHENEELGAYFSRFEGTAGQDGEGQQADIMRLTGEMKKTTLKCLGGLDDLKTILDGSAADEVVLALEDVPSYRAESVMRTIERYRAGRAVDVSMLTPYGNLIPAGSMIYEFGETRIIDLDGRQKKNRSAFGLGLVLSAALLLVMLILNYFGIGEVQRFEEYETCKCIIFAVFGVFLFSVLIRSFRGKSWANTKRAVITAACCLVFAAVYEFVYAGGPGDAGLAAQTGTAAGQTTEFLAFLMDDIKAIGVSTLICWCVAGIIRVVERDYPMMI